MENSFFEMALEASRDRRAEERFIKAMEPMVKKVASRFALRVKGASEFKDDMENAARLGIHNALMRFDFSYGGFDIYLEKAMEIEVRTFLNNNLRMIRIPKHMLEAMRKYRNGFNEEEFSSVKVRKIKDAMNVENCLSLDNAINEEDDGKTFASFVPSFSSPEVEYEKSEIESSLAEAVEALDFTEKYIIQSFFGISKEKKSLKAMASELGVSVMTVSGRRKRALDKLKVYLAQV